MKERILDIWPKHLNELNKVENVSWRSVVISRDKSIVHVSNIVECFFQMMKKTLFLVVGTNSLGSKHRCHSHCTVVLKFSVKRKSRNVHAIVLQSQAVSCGLKKKFKVQAAEMSLLKRVPCPEMRSPAIQESLRVELVPWKECPLLKSWWILSGSCYWTQFKSRYY